MARQSAVPEIPAPRPRLTYMRLQSQEERSLYRTVVATVMVVASEEESARDDDHPLKGSKCNKQIREKWA